MGIRDDALSEYVESGQRAVSDRHHTDPVSTTTVRRRSSIAAERRNRTEHERHADDSE